MKRMLTVLAAVLVLVSCPNVPQPPDGPVTLAQYTVLAWNDLGMH
jgi:hypothetical protein